MGVCANSDEHRGRCGGGVPGTAVFGTKGGLTGVLSTALDRKSVGTALRARRTFATTGQRLVGLLFTDDGALQGDEVSLKAGGREKVKYALYGESGFSSFEAWDASGCILERNIWAEIGKDRSRWNTVQVTWGGATLYERYIEAVWHGEIKIPGSIKIASVEPFGGLLDVPEEVIQQDGDQAVTFNTHTRRDFDGVNLSFSEKAHPTIITVSGFLGGYVKVGDALAGNPHKAQPQFAIEALWEEGLLPGGKAVVIAGGAELFVKIEVIPDVPLPKRLEGSLVLDGKEKGRKERAVRCILWAENGTVGRLLPGRYSLNIHRFGWMRRRNISILKLTKKLCLAIFTLQV